MPDNTLVQDLELLKQRIHTVVQAELNAFHATWEITPSSVVLDMIEVTQGDSIPRQFEVGEARLEFTI